MAKTVLINYYKEMSALSDRLFAEPDDLMSFPAFFHCLYCEYHVVAYEDLLAACQAFWPDNLMFVHTHDLAGSIADYYEDLMSEFWEV